MLFDQQLSLYVQSDSDAFCFFDAVCLQSIMVAFEFKYDYFCFLTVSFFLFCCFLFVSSLSVSHTWCQISSQKQQVFQSLLGSPGCGHHRAPSLSKQSGDQECLSKFSCLSGRKCTFYQTWFNQSKDERRTVAVWHGSKNRNRLTDC